jgi:hypothetical protein
LIQNPVAWIERSAKGQEAQKSEDRDALAIV